LSILMASTPVKIQFRSVSYTVDSTVILDGITLEVCEGDTVILLGESGCGKTTTLKMINRLIEPTGGEVLVGGKRTTDWDVIELRRGVGYVLQEAGLMPHFSVADNIGLVPTLEGWDKERRASRITEMMELVGLPRARFADRFPHELSCS
jgi:osmoprotectant transport system ATP-binding protein